MSMINFPAADFDFGLENSKAVFPVTTRDLQIVGRQPGCILPVDTHKAVIRTDADGSNPRGIGIVGRDFKLLKHRDLFGSIEASIQSSMARDLMRGVQVTTHTSFDGAWVKREYVFPAFASELKTSSDFKTNLGFRLIGWNAYDGSARAGLVSGLVDFYCTNGIVVGSMVDIAKRRHTKNLTADHFDGQIVLGLARCRREIDDACAGWRDRARHGAGGDHSSEELLRAPCRPLLARLRREVSDRGNNVFALHSCVDLLLSPQQRGVRRPQDGRRQRGQDAPQPPSGSGQGHAAGLRSRSVRPRPPSAPAGGVFGALPLHPTQGNHYAEE